MSIFGVLIKSNDLVYKQTYISSDIYYFVRIFRIEKGYKRASCVKIPHVVHGCGGHQSILPTYLKHEYGIECKESSKFYEQENCCIELSFCNRKSGKFCGRSPHDLYQGQVRKPIH